MSDRPQRTNEYTAHPATERYKQCLFEWLAAHAPLWNQITYRRPQNKVLVGHPDAKRLETTPTILPRRR